MESCLFCKIIEKEIPGKIVYEDEQILCFHDVDPQAPVHVLIVPKEHIPSLNHIKQDQEALIGHLMGKVKEIAQNLALEKGYRLVCNCGEDGLQTVDHLHFHLLGKRKMQWPPG